MIIIHADETTRAQRLIIVRAGAVDVYERVRETFGGPPGTRILYDRRKPRPTVQCSPGDRRFPQDPTILASRGFFATRARLIPSQAMTNTA